MTAAALPIANSYVALSPDNPVRREPRSPDKTRPDAFYRAFDRLTLFYDCFWSGDGSGVLLVGPPPMNLGAEYRAARYVARPSGTDLRARIHASLSVAITELSPVPEDTTAIEIVLAEETFVLPVEESLVQSLAGRRVLVAINRDNELGWIREWALWHVVLHGTDAVILFDNGSSRYTPANILATLRTVPGLAYAGVASWAYSYGPRDSASRNSPEWAQFLPVGALSVALRRYGEAAFGVLHCDIDELAGSDPGTSIYDVAKGSRGGLATFTGTWIEAPAQGVRHRDYGERLKDGALALSPRQRWVLDPGRPWVRKLSVHPYPHAIGGRPWLMRTASSDARYWHFRGINTNWKAPRTPPRKGATETDAALAAGFARLGL